MDDAHFPLADVFGVLERVAEDAFRGGFGDEFDALDDAVDDDVFDARVFAFGVLADEDEVDVVVGGFVAGYGFARAHVGEEVEGAAEREVEGDVAFADGGLCGVGQTLRGVQRGFLPLEGLSMLRNCVLYC